MSPRNKTGNAEFIRWLKQELARRRWNQSELARRMDVLPSAVSKWMSLEWRPDSNNCLRLSNVLGIDADFILELAGHARRTRIPESTNARQLKSMVDYIDWYKPGRYATVEGIMRMFKDEDERGDPAPGLFPYRPRIVSCIT